MRKKKPHVRVPSEATGYLVDGQWPTDLSRDKPYCKEGESESHIAAGVAVLVVMVSVPAWVLFLWWAGVIVL